MAPLEVEYWVPAKSMKNVRPKHVATESPSQRTFDVEARNLCYKSPPTHQSSLLNFFSQNQDNVASLQEKEASKFILKNVSCVAKSGEILAIAGPSGAGKSTLLELLGARIRPSTPQSSILVNGLPMDVPSFRRMSGFIPQNDALFPLLTVKETLMFSARLRLPASVSNEEKHRKVEDLLDELKLMHVADTRVGNDDMRGVSGGERRRVSIGVDVIHDPAVLLLDEPTSGLDSASALHVVEMLHTMAKVRSRTIILSIHQPGYRILQQIHSFLLLAHGSVIHHGSLRILHYWLMQAGHHIPPQVNVLEYAIDAISSGTDLKSDAENICILHRPGHFNPLQHFNTVGSDLLWSFDKADENPSMDFKPTFANNSMREIVILSERFSKNIFRTHELFIARTVQALVGGFAFGYNLHKCRHDAIRNSEAAWVFCVYAHIPPLINS